LRSAKDHFYLTGRFPQVFVTLKRAPLSVLPRVSEIPGVAHVQARIVQDVIVDRPASVLPVSARIVSIEYAGDEPLVRLSMRRGTAPSPWQMKSVAINEAFAEANAVAPGEDIRVILNGRVQAFEISGVALSPEFVYSVKPGLPIPDDQRYAIIWMDRRAAEAAFDMKAAFNDLVVAVAPGTRPQHVVSELDRLLEPYGSVGAIERRDQPSNRFLEDELNQQKVMSVTIPVIFFGVAAFLLNVTLGRLVAAQREQIAALKALGFPTLPIAAHYLKLVTIIVCLASLLGLPAGFAFGEAMVASYHGFFRFPSLEFRLTPWSTVAAFSLSLVMAAIGVLSSLRAVTMLAPAVAMRPAAPRKFRRWWIEHLLMPLMSKPHRVMIFRNIIGRPVRTALTILGVAFAVPMVILGLFWRDAVDHLIDVQFNLVERGNVSVSFPNPMDYKIIHDLSREAGVLAVEGQRMVPIRLRVGHKTYLTSAVGLPDRSELRRPHDAALRPIEIPAEGITLTRRLADRLDVRVGATIAVEVLEGRRLKVDLTISAVVDEMIGMSAYMPLAVLNRLTREGNVVSAAVMYVDAEMLPNLSQRFKTLPVLESVAMKSYTLASFMDKVANLVLVTAGILTLFGVIIAVGVVYNSARVGLQERAWELASLRVLGFTKAEVTRILFGEFALEISVGVPLGLVISQAIISLIARFHSNESFQIPGVIGARTYALSALIVVTAALASAYVVRRRINKLDLVSVLKTRD
jgi:putative ABC transport system permease protein